MNIDNLLKKARIRVNEHIDMLYIQALSSLSKHETAKEVTQEHIESYLKKRGYSWNRVLQKDVMVKDFTCVYIGEGYIEVWHDKTNNNKSVFVNDSLMTGLPITLNYMEAI
jgi:hypothetical protein